MTWPLLRCDFWNTNCWRLGFWVRDRPSYIPSGHVAPNETCSLCSLVHIRLSEACLFICDCWRRSGTTSGAMRTAMPRTIVVSSNVYIIIAPSYAFKDRSVVICPLPLVF